MRRILTISLLILAVQIKSQNIFNGLYTSTDRRAGTLKIKEGNTYEQKMSDCTYWFMTKGTYQIKSDTLTLTVSEVYRLSPGSRRKKIIADTSTNFYVLTQGFTNYFVKGDTLFVLRKMPNYYKRVFFPLTKVRTK